MDSPRQKHGITGSDIVMCAVLEAAGARLARRLIAGRTCPECGAKLSGRRPLRHLAGAALAEIVLDGMVAQALARRRQRTRVDEGTGVDLRGPAPTPGQYARIPQQRAAPEPTRAHLAAS